MPPRWKPPPFTACSGSDHLRRNWRCRPFRAPHHTASGVALVGGGSNPRPGEISLAHNGILFLDEMTEFDRRVLDVLREPLETGVIHIARAARHAEYPARFQLVGAMNPCPQGFDCDLADRCQCSPEQRHGTGGAFGTADRPHRHRGRGAAAADHRTGPGPRSGRGLGDRRRRVRPGAGTPAQRQGKMNSVLSGRELDGMPR
jgi:magnesium chelatase family protein